MANVFLKFGGHFIKHGSLLGRDIQKGHVYEKVWEEGVNARYSFQTWNPKESIFVDKIDVVNIEPTVNTNQGFMSMFHGSDGMILVTSSKNSRYVRTEEVTVGGETMYHHTFEVDHVAFSNNLSYEMAISKFNPNQWIPYHAYAYAAEKQDGTLIDSNVWTIDEWISNLPSFRDGDPGLNCSGIGGFSIQLEGPKPLAFIMINDKNWAEL